MSKEAKVKKPFYKKWWVLLIIAILLISIFSKKGGNESGATTETSKAETKQAVTYEAVESKKLLDDLTGNALKAKDTYKDKNVEITGVLDNIDASGKYITIIPNEGDMIITGIQAYIKNDDQKKVVMDLAKGDKIVIKGKITDVGELLGYSVDIDEIVKK